MGTFRFKRMGSLTLEKKKGERTPEKEPAEHRQPGALLGDPSLSPISKVFQKVNKDRDKS